MNEHSHLLILRKLNKNNLHTNAVLLMMTRTTNGVDLYLFDGGRVNDGYSLPSEAQRRANRRSAEGQKNELYTPCSKKTKPSNSGSKLGKS